MSQAETGWNTENVVENSRVPETDVLYAEFADKEYLHMEVYGHGDGQSVVWSSALGIASFLEVARNVVGAPESDPRLTSIAHFGDEELESNPAEIEAKVLGRQNEVSLYSSGYEDLVVAWRMPHGGAGHAEVGISSEQIKPQQLIDFLSRTATSRVVEAVSKNPDPLLQKLPDNS